MALLKVSTDPFRWIRSGYRRVYLLPLLAALLIILVCTQLGLPELLRFPFLKAHQPYIKANDDWRTCNGNTSCCARILSPATRPHTVVTARSFMPTGNSGRNLEWRMATHQDSDIVSAHIQRTGAWDASKSQTILTVLGDSSKRTVLVDIGANIGWYTLLGAYAGYGVIAAEPFAENLALLRHSLCLAPEEVRSRVQLLPYSLGHKDGMRCELWQLANVNRGDTHTICQGKSTAPGVSVMRDSGYRKLGEARMQKLDSLFSNGVVTLANDSRVIVKIDVEGFEPMAIEGAQKFLEIYKPEKVYSEFGEGMIQSASQAVGESVEISKKRPQSYLDMMRVKGYIYTMTRTATDGFGNAINEAVFSRS